VPRNGVHHGKFQEGKATVEEERDFPKDYVGEKKGERNGLLILHCDSRKSSNRDEDGSKGEARPYKGKKVVEE